MDVSDISGGDLFKKKIDQALYECKVFIPIIDNEWTGVINPATGENRISLADDFIAFEVQSALLRNKAIIPVLMENSSLPQTDELPTNIQSLFLYNVKRLKHESWERDVQDLTNTLYKYLPNSQKKFQAFISCPMTSLNDGIKYLELKQTVRNVILFQGFS